MRNLFFLSLITLFISCNQSPSLKTVAYSSIQEPENLTEYFQDLLMDDANYCVGGDSLEMEQIFRSCRLLQDYADGKTENYPAWSIKQALGHMAFRIIQADSEGYCYDPDTINCTACCLNNFLDAYLDQVFHFCPDIKLLLPLVSDDEEIGIFNFENFNIPYLVRNYGAPTYIVYKDTKGMYQKAFWTEGDSYENIYQINHNGKQYYLMVKLAGHFGLQFSLISLDEEGVKECLQPVSENIRRLMRDISLSEYDKEIFPETERLIFNSQELVWKECRLNKNGYWAEFPGSKTFRLIFSDKIYVRME